MTVCSCMLLPCLFPMTSIHEESTGMQGTGRNQSLGPEPHSITSATMDQSLIRRQKFKIQNLSNRSGGPVPQTHRDAMQCCTLLGRTTLDSLSTKCNSRYGTQPRKNSQSDACNLLHPEKLPSVLGCSFWVTFHSWRCVWCLKSLFSPKALLSPQMGWSSYFKIWALTQISDTAEMAKLWIQSWITSVVRSSHEAPVVFGSSLIWNK